jgi:hypothetical protein
MNTITGVFHKAFGLPNGIERFTGTWKCEYTAHANSAALTDRYGKIALPETIHVKGRKIVEAHFVQGLATKVVARVKYNDRFDLVVVLTEPDAGVVRVITCWLNEIGDNHPTLRGENYQFHRR